uniref:Uncharacterized protein n=1 Tax=Myotis myotis TaxID=51298 RepID=A0A7J7T695_MYOMY|nr:hypothetical protein mMyoMyo1_009167 [Myotis myotis]
MAPRAPAFLMGEVGWGRGHSGTPDRADRRLFLCRGRRVVDRAGIFCSRLNLAVGGEWVQACTCVLKACKGQRGPETSCSQWVPLDSTPIPSGISQEHKVQMSSYTLATTLALSLKNELIVPPARAQLEGPGRSASPPKEPTGAQRGEEAKSHGTLGLSQDQNHTGLKTLHSEAASGGSCCPGRKNPAWGPGEA